MGGEDVNVRGFGAVLPEWVVFKLDCFGCRQHRVPVFVGLLTLPENGMKRMLYSKTDHLEELFSRYVYQSGTRSQKVVTEMGWFSFQSRK